MKKKKEKTKKKGFVDLASGQLRPYLTIAPKCPDKPVKCHMNRPSRRRLDDCPVDAAGECNHALAWREQVQQVVNDPETVHALLQSVDEEEKLRALLFSGNDEDVPDELFFEVIKLFGYEILSLPLAQQKMARWQEEKRNTDEDIQRKAQDNMKEIGSSLVYIGHQRNDPAKGWVALARRMYYDEIQSRDLSKINNINTLKPIVRALMVNAPYAFLKPSPEQADAILKDMDTACLKAATLADYIVSKLFDLKPSVVRQYCKPNKLPNIFFVR